MMQTMTAKYIVLTLLAVVMVVFTANEARAEPRSRGGGVIRLEEITIEGRVQKPNAFYVLQRSSLGFEMNQGESSFIQDVLESVDKEPF